MRRVAIVRHPIGRPSAAARVLGMGDVVVLNDPIAGQGARAARLERRGAVPVGGTPAGTRLRRPRDFADWIMDPDNATRI
jgi:hypothetical protein